MLEGRQSFKLCFLTYSDSHYRDKVADFLEARVHARVRVSIDSEPGSVRKSCSSD